jgi:hypothetical protein
LRPAGEYVIHTTLVAGGLICDANDNSSLEATCAPEVSEPSGRQLTVDKNGSLLDLNFEDVGALDYNVYTSTAKESLVSDPFDVETPAGKRDCAETTVDNGADRTIVGYDVETGLNPTNLYYFLIGASSLVHNGTLGNNFEGERAATSYCVP